MSDVHTNKESRVTPRRSMRLVATLLAVIVIASTVIIVWKYNEFLAHNLTSEDAIIEADIVHIGALVPGKLQTLPVQDGQRVKRGELLMQIDPTTYELRVRQAKAELALAQAALSNQMRRIRAESANAEIADEQIERARVNLDLATKTLERLESLLPKGYVTAQQVDMARTALHDAQVSLSQAIAQHKAAQALIGETQASQAAVDVATAGLAIAEKALSDTTVTAPHDGLIVGLNVSAGEMLAPEQTLFTLIDTQAWYATALFRETELPSVQIGNCVTVYAMAAPKTPMSGRIQSIGWGVVSEDLINLPRMLPVVQKSLNWVRVAQRFPVRILITDPVPDLMRMGASATVTVRNDSDC